VKAPRAADLVVYVAGGCVVLAIVVVMLLAMPAEIRAGIPFLPRWLQW